MISISRSFNNFKDLFTAIRTDTEQALNHTADLTKELIDSFINQWYNDYTPTVYERTYQLLNAVIRTDVQKSGNKMNVTIYLDKSLLAYDTDTDGILQAADNGLHGSINNHYEEGERHVRLWSDSIEQIKDTEMIFTAFENYLKNKGYDIKRK